MDETQELLQRASNEIKSLRNQLQIANARLTVFDDMMMLLRTPPIYPSMGMSPDISWEIEEHITRLGQDKQEG